MSAPKSLADFSTPIAAPAGEYVSQEHPRFAQIQCHLEGTHPDVRVGQVWEDLDPRKGGRHVLVTSVNTDGTTDVVTVYIGTSGAGAQMGHRSNIATHRFRVMDGGRGFRLRAALVMLTDARVPVNLDAVPKAQPLSALVEIDKPPAPAPQKTEVKKPPTPKDVSSEKKDAPKGAPAASPTPQKESEASSPEEQKTADKEQKAAEVLDSQGREVGALLIRAEAVMEIKPFHASIGLALVDALGFEDAKKFAQTVDPKTIPDIGHGNLIMRMVKAGKAWRDAQVQSSVEGQPKLLEATSA